jgi:hypothetical protein
MKISNFIKYPLIFVIILHLSFIYMNKSINPISWSSNTIILEVVLFYLSIIFGVFIAILLKK